jgi:LmbE family N-acetylglucosaminyl deacetylase
MRGPCLLLAALLYEAGPSAAAADELPRMATPGPNDRVMVIAPHPDDESLCCAGLLQQAVSHGAAVGVVWITAGDGFELDALVVEHTLSPGSGAMQRLGKQRLAEARAAADRLGVPRSAQYLLGYPDRSIEALIGAYHDHPYRSKYTASSSVRYAGAVSPGASYTGANLERDLQLVLDEFQPTLVAAPAPQDLHPDHRASGELALALLERRAQRAALRYWIIHAHGWPRPFGLNPALSLVPPDAAAALDWETLPLSAAERARKYAALREHRSQMELMASLMKAFVRANELFATPRQPR